MDLAERIGEFSTKGFTILEIENEEEIEIAKGFVSNSITQKKNQNMSSDYILNNIHIIEGNMTDAKANQMTMGIINAFKEKYDMSEVVYRSAKTFIDKILGMDIASQKHPNIVFQYPGSMRYSELHTDAPKNSCFELVAWLPLVDCYGTKSFYIIDYNKSIELLQEYREQPGMEWARFKERCMTEATHLKINYGEVLIFWSGLIHGSLVNESQESRLSFNTRFKQLYAPGGLKDPLIFYKVLQTSPITEFAINYK